MKQLEEQLKIEETELARVLELPNKNKRDFYSRYYEGRVALLKTMIAKSNTYDVIKQAQSDAKYLNRLNKVTFKNLVFPNSPDDGYIDAKWELFKNSKMEFFWSCSYDKLNILGQYIDNCKGN